MILQDRRWSDALGSARLHPLTDEADNLGILDLRDVLVELAYGPEVERNMMILPPGCCYSGRRAVHSA